MFADAYARASQFTHPLIASIRLYDGTVKSSIGAFLILNPEGWVLTAAHLISVVVKHQQDSERIVEYEERRAVLDAAETADPAEQRRLRELSRLTEPNPEWITNLSFWWGSDNIRSSDFTVFPAADLAVTQLEGFKPDMISEYPVFKDPTTMRCGTSLCRLGFPFHRIKSSFDEETGNFRLDESALPVPRFPIEGIYTRNAVKQPEEGGRPVKLLETSSAGLRGQSGGPIFDTQATVYAIQTQTRHLPLGFSPKIETEDGREIQENQFLNVGLGVHAETVTAFLREHEIPFEISDY